MTKQFDSSSEAALTELDASLAAGGSRRRDAFYAD